MRWRPISTFFFFNDTATTEIYTLSLHDALPICDGFDVDFFSANLLRESGEVRGGRHDTKFAVRSEEHTSELQSQSNLVCRLLLEKKKSLGAYALTCSSSTPVSRRARNGSYYAPP